MELSGARCCHNSLKIFPENFEMLLNFLWTPMCRMSPRDPPPPRCPGPWVGGPSPNPPPWSGKEASWGFGMLMWREKTVRWRVRARRCHDSLLRHLPDALQSPTEEMVGAPGARSVLWGCGVCAQMGTR